MLMDYVEHANPSDVGGVLDALRDFAVTKGWSVDGYVGGVLQLSSSGYGNQRLVFRFAAENQSDYYANLLLAGINPNSPAYSSNIWTNSFTTDGNHYRISLRGDGAFKVWIAGNDKVLVLAHQNNEYSMTSFVVGTYELFDTAGDDGIFALHSRYYDKQYNWDTLNSNLYVYFTPPGSQFNHSGSYHTWWRGAAKDGDVRSNLYVTFFNSPKGYFDKLDSLLAQGSNLPYTGNRLLLKPTVYGLDTDHSVWRPIGRWPYYLLKVTDLQPGQLLSCGNEQYMVLPSMYIPYSYGWAIRVA